MRACVCFAMAFLLESIMKLLAMGPRWYFLDPWNSFDFIVLGISGVSLAVDVLMGEWRCPASSASGNENTHARIHKHTCAKYICA